MSPNHMPPISASAHDILQSYSDELETIEPDESETAQAIADAMLSISRKTYKHSGHATRSVHAKSHGIVRAEFEVLGDLSPALAQGLFAKAGRYQSIIRFSTIPGDILHDSVSTPRGMAIKVLDVEGERLDNGRPSTSQDFVLVNGKQFSTSNPKAFLRSLKMIALTTDRVEALKIAASKIFRRIETAIEAGGGESGLLKSLGGHPPTHILGESYFSQLPLRYGDYVAKFSVVPASEALTALVGRQVDIDDDYDGLRHAVSDFFAQNDAVWEVRVQLCSDVGEMPIEDATAVWDESISPFITVARITAQAQPSWQAPETQALNDSLGFSPWDGLTAHRPLGSIMRMRQLAYQKTQAFRSERNPLPVEEPSIDDAGPADSVVGNAWR